MDPGVLVTGGNSDHVKKEFSQLQKHQWGQLGSHCAAYVVVVCCTMCVRVRSYVCTYYVLSDRELFTIACWSSNSEVNTQASKCITKHTCLLANYSSNSEQMSQLSGRSPFSLLGTQKHQPFLDLSAIGRHILVVYSICASVLVCKPAESNQHIT